MTAVRRLLARVKAGELAVAPGGGPDSAPLISARVGWLMSQRSERGVLQPAGEHGAVADDLDRRVIRRQPPDQHEQ